MKRIDFLYPFMKEKKGTSDSTGGGDGSVLSFQTLAQLQSAYPNGTNQPVWVISEKAWYYWSGEITENPTPTEPTNPSDTTSPVLTITPSSTFTDTKTVTMSTDETATIWYTLDESDPKTSGTRNQYTAPLTLTETDTIKAYAVDSTGNSSAVQTVVYTKNTGETTYQYLNMNGTSDYLKTPSLTFDEIVMDFHPEQNNTWQTYLDARGGVANSYIQNNASMSDTYNASVWTGIYVDGGAKQTALNNNLVPRNARTNIRFTLTTAGTDDVSIFSKFDNTEFMKGKIYDIKFKNAGVVVAHYDMTKGNVQDQSGNGKHATLTGGTFV